MYEELFRHGQLHTPYRIFVRGEGRYSDTDLLRLLGLPTYQFSRSANRLSRYVLLADDGPWKMVADDWYYTLWHMPSTRPALEELGKVCDVFACSIGDTDCSFDFVYYSEGQLARRFVVVDPNYRGGKVVENTGQPLPGETAELFELGEERIVLEIAASLGIKTAYTARDIRVYGPPK